MVTTAPGVTEPATSVALNDPGGESGSVSFANTEPVTKTAGALTVCDAATCSCVLPIVSYASPVACGGSLTGFTVIVKVTDPEVSTPPFAVPPLSVRYTVTVAEPNAFIAVLNVS